MPDQQLKSTTDSWSEVGSHACTAHAPMGFKKYPVSLADGAIYRRRRQRNSMLPLPWFTYLSVLFPKRKSFLD